MYNVVMDGRGEVITAGSLGYTLHVKLNKWEGSWGGARWGVGEGLDDVGGEG